MTVATLNPFDLLNEDVVPKTVVKKTTSAIPVTTSATKTATASATTKPVTTAAPASKKGTNSAELNANVSEKTPLRRNNNHTRRSTNSVSDGLAAGTERQERRRTDRHSRTGYKQDGEKRLTSGKGSWGKAVEQGEENVTVDESVAVAEGTEDAVEEATSGNASGAIASEPVVPHLTLAQYQATLKKPATAPTATRKITTSVPAAQIVKKETEVFVFPEIVKKSAAAKKPTEKTTASSVDLSKYISVKAVSSVEPRERTERSRDTRPERTNERNGDNRRNSTNNNNSNNNRNSKRESTTTTTTASSKLNLDDNRSFPALGSK